MLFLPPAPRACVLLVAPLFEEKRCAHRALVTCAEALAADGAAVLLPDLSGAGNSDGRPAEIGLERWLDDLQAAADYLQGRAEAPLCLIGCRAGALLATRLPAAARLLLWQPVLSGKNYLRQLRTRRMVQDAITGEKPRIGPYEVEGQELSASLFAVIETLALPDAPPSGDVRLLQCSFQDHLLTEYTRLAARWPHLQTRCLVSEPFWNPHTPAGYAELAAALTEEALLPPPGRGRIELK